MMRSAWPVGFVTSESRRSGAIRTLDAVVTARAVAGELGGPAVRVQAAGPEALEALADEFRGETLLGIVPEPLLAELLDQLFPAERHRAPMSAGSCRWSYDGEAWTTNP